MSDPLIFETPGSLVSMEYIKRTGPFKMQTGHYHNFYEIYYLVSGQRRYFIEDRSYSIQEGDLVFINPQVLHQTSDEGESAHERIVIYFTESFLRNSYHAEADLLLRPYMRDNPVYRLQVKERMQVEALMEKLMHEMRTKETGYELAIRLGVIDLLLSAARYSARSNVSPLDTPLYRKITDIVRFINENYAEPLTLNSLAGKFHVSPYYLSRTFKQATGLTIFEYMNITRIKAAEQLLKQSVLSVTDVSSAVGYNNFSHFGKMFKKHTKATPREYRKS
ncbi:AraC family transcriptional regulator [Paenibacillus spongiae]|uniref:AraC family transcriptional regulator n=1 Tax=Paenibacillus spongiae TaxID=2909671 RepID=A0ABY5SEL4_9BACL|nr:AraC family transcriptional regulator [Paenibacillus spongiae]UVI31973.1 AraC family transcriptional regulator [Paenibacillus spongiae]